MHRREFTVVELLVTIVIIRLLMALLLPAVQSVHESSRRVQCKSNRKQIGIAAAAYEAVHQVVPPGSSNAFSLHVFILPYVEQEVLYNTVDFSQSAIRGNEAVRSPRQSETVIHLISSSERPTRRSLLF